MATTPTTTTTLTEIVPKIWAKTMLILQATCGILDTVRLRNTVNEPGTTVEFATYTPVTSAEVETPGEATATTNVIDHGTAHGRRPYPLSVYQITRSWPTSYLE